MFHQHLKLHRAALLALDVALDDLVELGLTGVERGHFLKEEVDPGSFSKKEEPDEFEVRYLH